MINRISRIKFKNLIKYVLIMLLIVSFILPYYANAVPNNEDEEDKGRGTVPAAVGKLLEGITTVTDSSSIYSNSNGAIATNYPETGDGYNSLTEVNGTKYKNYKQFRGSYAEKSYWTGTMHNSGCGPTSVAIVASRLWNR